MDVGMPPLQESVGDLDRSGVPDDAPPTFGTADPLTVVVLLAFVPGTRDEGPPAFC